MADHSSGWSEYGSAYDLPPYGGIPRTYLVATTQRTGSHHLAHLLGALGTVGVPFEYLNEYRVSLELRRRQWSEDDASKSRLLEEIRTRRTGSSGWFGVKAHWHTWERALTREVLQPRAFICITREDRVAQAASLARAEQTGSWVDEGSPKAFRPVYSEAHITDALRRLTAERSAWERYFSERRIEPMSITYEALLANSEAVLQAVQDHLGVPTVGTISSRFPTIHARTDRVVEEWAERYRVSHDSGAVLTR